MNAISAAAGIAVLAASLLVAVLSVADAFEVLDLFRQRARQASAPEFDLDPDGSSRHLAVHVPTYSEPPEIVLRNLKALKEVGSLLKEVIVVDNNTSEEELWRPLELFCEASGAPFRFFHVPVLAGNKAGALNFALARTHVDVEIVLVLDADYVISPNFIHTLRRFFVNPKVVFVQAPQAYFVAARPALHDLLMVWEYWQFFSVGMHLRNLRNAILLHGTMVAIRRAALDAVNGWAEWCLTDDSEMGIRLLATGGCAVYLAQPMGRGVLPVSHEDFLKQRRRWVMGGAQQLRRHFRELVRGKRGGSTEATLLSLPQRSHILQGWLSWARDASLIAAFVPTVLFAALGVVGNNTYLATTLSYVVLFSVLLNAAKQMLIYRWHLRVTLGASVAMTGFILGMTTTIGLAWMWGLIPGRRSFFRTPKLPQLRRSLSVALIPDLFVVILSVVLVWFTYSSEIRPALGIFGLLGLLGSVSPLLRAVRSASLGLKRQPVSFRGS